MLAGLIFATEDADDKAGILAETLPFGGLTLIEFQARLLIAAGATQIVLAVARMTPGLLGAISRIGRRGVSVDAVRTAVEALEKLHPLARVLVVADGLVTTADAVAAMLTEPGDAMLVIGDDQPGFERIGVATAWAGLALIDARRIADVAAMPNDYDFQSTMLRIVAQSGARHVRVPDEAKAAHAIERDSRALTSRGNATVATLVARPVRWAERYCLAPIVRIALPTLFAHTVPTWPFALGAVVSGLSGLIALHLGFGGVGILLALIAILAAGIGATLGWLRDEAGHMQAMNVAGTVLAALVVLVVGEATQSAVGWLLALVAIVTGVLVERIGLHTHPRRWWFSPAAAPILLLPFLVAGFPFLALGAVGFYAFVTLFGAIEMLHEKR